MLTTLPATETQMTTMALPLRIPCKVSRALTWPVQSSSDYDRVEIRQWPEVLFLLHSDGVWIEDEDFAIITRYNYNSHNNKE